MKIILAALWFISSLWGSFYLIKDYNMLKVWWGYPYFVTSVIVIFLGTLLIFLYERK